jgi:hypothetical protein
MTEQLKGKNVEDKEKEKKREKILLPFLFTFHHFLFRSIR